jgi:hypothetical protein
MPYISDSRTRINYQEISPGASLSATEGKLMTPCAHLICIPRAPPFSEDSMLCPIPMNVMSSQPLVLKAKFQGDRFAQSWSVVIVKAFYKQSSYICLYILYIIYGTSHPLVSFTFPGLPSQIHKPIALQLIRQRCKRRSEVHPLLVYAHHPGQRVGVAEDP